MDFPSRVRRGACLLEDGPLPQANEILDRFRGGARALRADLDLQEILRNDLPPGAEGGGPAREAFLGNPPRQTDSPWPLKACERDGYRGPPAVAGFRSLAAPAGDGVAPLVMPLADRLPGARHAQVNAPARGSLRHQHLHIFGLPDVRVAHGFEGRTWRERSGVAIEVDAPFGGNEPELNAGGPAGTLVGGMVRDIGFLAQPETGFGCPPVIRTVLRRQRYGG